MLPVSGNIWDPGSWIPEDVGIFNDALKALDFGLGENLNVKPLVYNTVLLLLLCCSCAGAVVLAYEVSRIKTSENFESLWSQEAPSSNQLELQVQLH